MKLVVNSEVERLCPVCEGSVKLVVKENRRTGHQFLGCPEWPYCEHTEGIPESLKMEALGATKLPGFE